MSLVSGFVDKTGEVNIKQLRQFLKQNSININFRKSLLGFIDVKGTKIKEQCRFAILKDIQDEYFSRLVVDTNMYLIKKIGTELVHIYSTINIKLPYGYTSKDGCKYTGKTGKYFGYAIPKEYVYEVNTIALVYSQSKLSSSDILSGVKVLGTNGDFYYLYLVIHNKNKSRTVLNICNNLDSANKSLVFLLRNLEVANLIIPTADYVELIEGNTEFTLIKSKINPETIVEDELL